MANYKEFRVGDLFEGKTGDVDLQARDIDGKGEYFVNSGVQNQGIKGRTSRKARIFPAGTITVDFFGNAYLRNFPFKMATHNHVFALIGKQEIPHNAKLYIVAALSKLSSLHSFNNMLTWTILQDVKIQLPVTPTGEPDFAYMEERITELEVERIAELERYLVATGLDDCVLSEEDKRILSLSPFEALGNNTYLLPASGFRKKVAEFKIGDLFEKLNINPLPNGIRQKLAVKHSDVTHSIPLTAAKMGDNGTMYWGSPDDFKTANNCIVVVYDGAVSAGSIYAHEGPVGIFSHSYIIKSKTNIPFAATLFIAGAMQKVIYPKYSRDNPSRWTNKVENDKIYLPITDLGQPDFDYMASYIRAQEKLAIADVIKLKDKSIAEAEAIIANKNLRFPNVNNTKEQQPC